MCNSWRFVDFIVRFYIHFFLYNNQAACTVYSIHSLSRSLYPRALNRLYPHFRAQYTRWCELLWRAHPFLWLSSLHYAAIFVIYSSKCVVVLPLSWPCIWSVLMYGICVFNRSCNPSEKFTQRYSGPLSKFRCQIVAIKLQRTRVDPVSMRERERERFEVWSLNDK